MLGRIVVGGSRVGCNRGEWADVEKDEIKRSRQEDKQKQVGVRWLVRQLPANAAPHKVTVFGVPLAPEEQ